MRIALVLAITIPLLFASGVACGGDEEEARVTPIPATDSDGEAEEAEEEEEGEEGEEEGAEAEKEEEEPPVEVEGSSGFATPAQTRF